MGVQLCLKKYNMDKWPYFYRAEAWAPRGTKWRPREMRGTPGFDARPAPTASTFADSVPVES